MKTGESYRLKLYLREILTLACFSFFRGVKLIPPLDHISWQRIPAFTVQYGLRWAWGGIPWDRELNGVTWLAHRNGRKSMGFAGYFFHPDRSGVTGSPTSKLVTGPTFWAIAFFQFRRCGVCLRGWLKDKFGESVSRKKIVQWEHNKYQVIQSDLLIP